MTKKFIFSIVAALTAMSASAFSTGAPVLTNQGRFVITNENNLYQGNFTDFKGWTVNSAAEGMDISSIFTTGTDAEYGTYISSLTNGQNEGMSYTYTPSDPSASFVVSMMVKGTDPAPATPLSTTHTDYSTYLTAGANIIKVEGINADTSVVLNTGLTLPAGWSTVAFGVVGSSDYNSYKITIQALNTSLEIADIQIQSAKHTADLRQRDAVLKYANAFAAVFSDELDDEYTKTYNKVQAIDENSTQEELDKQKLALEEQISTVKTARYDQLALTQSHFGIWETKVQKASTWGEWTCYPISRAFCVAGAYPEFGRYAGYYNWGGSTDGFCGISMNAKLQPGKYVFVTNALGQAREMKSSRCWDVCTSLDYVYGNMYVCKEGLDTDGTTAIYTDTLATTGKYGISPLDFTQGVLSFEVTEAGTYQIGMKSYAYENNVGAMLGGSLQLKDVEFYGNPDTEFTKAEEAYFQNVSTQVTAAREELTTSCGYRDNASYYWGKADISKTINVYEPKVELYEDLIANNKAEVIATMPENYVSGKVDADDSGMEATVYQTITKKLIAANKSFVAQNDTLNSLSLAISNAQAILNEQLYTHATERDQLSSAIAKAVSLRNEMQASDYSVDNASKIIAMNAELAAAIDKFTNSVPSDYITTLVDIDFSNAAQVSDSWTAYTSDNTGVSATIAGKVGYMSFSNFSCVSPTTMSNCPFELGYDGNGEKDSVGILRVGNGNATVPVSGAAANASDIVKVSFDYYFGNYINKNAGYFLLSEEGDTICGLACSKYSNTSIYNTFNVDYTNYITSLGSAMASNAAIAASGNATRFTIILNYGSGKMCCTTSGAKGTFKTDTIDFDSSKKLGTFVLYSNYINKDRRSWFDNLKIQNISGSGSVPVDPVVPSTLTLTDENPTITAGTYSTGDVSYKRTVSSGYETFCLPFRVSCSEMPSSFKKVYTLNKVSFLNETTGKLRLLLTEKSMTSTIAAGTSFIVKCDEAGEVTLSNSAQVDFTGTPADKSTTFTVYQDNGTSLLINNTDVTAKYCASYSPVTGLDANNCSTLTADGKFTPVTSVSPFHMYIYKDDSASSAKISGVEIIFEDDVTTGIVGIEDVNGEMDADIYNIAGQRVNADAKGLLISNGKKHFNK